MLDAVQISNLDTTAAFDQVDTIYMNSAGIRNKQHPELWKRRALGMERVARVRVLAVSDPKQKWREVILQNPIRILQY